MRRVQLQGGARELHARRTSCTLSVQPRAAPPTQMGPYHRSRGLSEKTLARAMRRVQLQGGARELHARRTSCTLSVQPRAAPPTQMGPYHRSRGLSEKTLARAM